MDKEAITELFDKYIKKLRITPAWDVRLSFVEDPTWRKTETSRSTVTTEKRSCI